MLIRVGYEMVFEPSAPTPMILLLALDPARETTVRRPGGLRVVPEVPVSWYVDRFNNRCARVVAPAGRVTFWDDLIVEDPGTPDPADSGAIQHPIEDLPDEVLPFLLASRYCEVDLLSDIAWGLFGSTPLGWSRARTICDWVHHHVTFGYGYARPTKSAFDVYNEKNGVCRDFTHLAITMSRCMNIPARYATGYLGDIGVPLSPNAMDFSGWYEVYLGGRWHALDARHNVPRIGRVVMARGRDAVDAALTTAFGSAPLKKFTVWTKDVPESALSAPAAIPDPPERPAFDAALFG